MARNISNFFIIASLFFLGSKYYPEHIFAQDNKTLIIATLAMFIIGILIAYAVVFLCIIIPPIGCLSAFALIFIVPIELMLTSYCIEGFEINGFWTYMFLWVVISIFSIRVNVNMEKK